MTVSDDDWRRRQAEEYMSYQLRKYGLWNPPRMYSMAYDVPMTPVKPVWKNPCPHKTIPLHLAEYTKQRVEYYRQVYPKHILPSQLEGAEMCCVLYHYKNLKKI